MPTYTYTKCMYIRTLTYALNLYVYTYIYYRIEVRGNFDKFVLIIINSVGYKHLNLFGNVIFILLFSKFLCNKSTFGT